MQQERGDVRDSSTQGSAGRAVGNAASADVEFGVAWKGRVFGPPDQPMVARAEQLALRVCVKSREAVDRRRLGRKRE